MQLEQLLEQLLELQSGQRVQQVGKEFADIEGAEVWDYIDIREGRYNAVDAADSDIVHSDNTSVA